MGAVGEIRNGLAEGVGVGHGLEFEIQIGE